MNDSIEETYQPQPLRDMIGGEADVRGENPRYDAVSLATPVSCRSVDKFVFDEVEQLLSKA